MGGGGKKVPYPKYVWSPAGGWYCQPRNWKANTAITLAVMFGVTCLTWTISAHKEEHYNIPEPGRFFPSRYWSKSVIEHDRQQREKALANEGK